MSLRMSSRRSSLVRSSYSTKPHYLAEEAADHVDCGLNRPEPEDDEPDEEEQPERGLSFGFFHMVGILVAAVR